MSWINDIAGKAENFLNKIDNSAAAVLSKEKKKKLKKVNQESISEDNYSVSINVNNIKAKYSPPPVKKSPKREARDVKRDNTDMRSNTSQNNDEQLMQYLNGSATDLPLIEEMNETKEFKSHPLPSLPPSLAIQEMDRSLVSSTSSLGFDEALVANLKNENEMLRNEVRSLNSEVSLLMSRTKNAEREAVVAKDLLSKKEGDLAVLNNEILSLKQSLTNLENEHNSLYKENLQYKDSSSKSSSGEDQNSYLKSFENAQTQLSEYQLQAQRREEALKGEINALRKRVSEVERELVDEKTEWATELRGMRDRLSAARLELEEDRAKWGRALSEKEALIEELRTGPSLAAPHLHLQHLMDEKICLEGELKKLDCKLDRAREEEAEVEGRLEESRARERNLRGRLEEETTRRQAAEERAVSRSEELVSVRDELWRQVSSLSSRLREREMEVSRLRGQVCGRGDLAEELASKQRLVERLTTELTHLRTHLPKRSPYSLDLSMKPGQDYLDSVNDTDDAKARLPRFLTTGSVKRAYTCVEALGRCVFVRRHPAYRFVFFSYLVVLHLWLCLVLFSYTPDSKMQE